MKLKDYKFNRKEDYIVFKALLRCYKEFGLTERFAKKRLTNAEIIKKCYDSRKGHPRENFLKNIYYWPGDIGITRSDDFKLLYYIILLSELDNEGLSHTSMAVAVKAMLRNPFGAGLKKYIDKGYKHLLVKAMTKVFENTDEKTNNEIIDLIMKGTKEQIPF